MMNRTWRSVFSILLAVALLLPMAPAAHAEEGTTPDPTVATKVELSSNVADNRIYYRKDNAGEITVTAIVFPSNYSGSIQWILSDGKSLTEVSRTEVSGGQASITFRAESPVSQEDTPTVIAVLDRGTSTDKLRSDPLVIRVAKDTVNTASLGFKQSEVSVQIGKTVSLSLGQKPAYLSGVGTPTLTYESSAPAIASVDKDGNVTGLKEGAAIISARVDGAPLSSTVRVSVLPLSTSLTGNATVGTNFSMRDIYESLLSQFSSSYGAAPTKVKFPGLNRANATLRTKSGDAVVSGDPYDFSQLRDMYLEPTNEGTFTCTAAVTNDVNSINGTITVTIGVPTVTVRVPIDGSTNYVFSQPSADSSGKSGAQIIRGGVGTFGSIVFGAVDAASENVGSLYTTTTANNNNRVSRGTCIEASAVDELYFTPSRSGTYTVPFTAYQNSSGFGAVVCTGEMILPVDGTSLDLTVNLSSVSPYTFSESPSSGANSLYALLLSAINGSVGGTTWGGIKFDGAASASSNGTLHQTSAHSRAISAEDYIAKSSISKLYYVPDRSGTYEIVYGIYGSAESTKPIATGKLTFVTSTIPVGASNITYTTTVKGSLALQESDFVDYYQSENGGTFQLSHVIFNEYNGDGTFYHGTSSFIPYNSPDCYASTYTGTVPANAHYLNRLTFNAPAASGYTSVLFTCYGASASSGVKKTTTGKLTIYYTANEVPAVSYTAFGVSSVDLREADFETAYNAALSSSVNKPVFNVKLLSAPQKGTLYYYSSNTRRTITSSNLADYTFTVNNSTGVSINDLAYSPAQSAFGTDEIRYLVTSAAGATLYVGTLQFKLSSDMTLNVTNDGSNFRLADFYSASDKDPVIFITFPKPSSGKLYVYSENRYISAPAETKYYTVSASDGRYAITDAFYAPKANEAGTVSLQCVMHRKSGATNTNSITVNVLSKTSSGSFGDVGGVTGWASNSIDFAARMGLVKGTQANPPLFSPSNTMRRCDFVLMLYRLAGAPKQSTSAVFSDVTADKYYYDSAVWAYRNNIMRNVTVNNQYNPDGALTRQDFAQILFNYTNAMGERNTSNNGTIRGYADASKVDANTLEGVTWAVANGYITSAVVGQLYIEPQRAATRAEISTLLHRYLTY